MEVSPASLVSSWPDLFASQHVGVFGKTDGGKSYMLRYVAGLMPGIITYVNPEEEDVPGVVIRSPEDWLKVVAKGKTRHIDFVTHPDADVAVAQLARLQPIQFRLGEKLRPRERSGKPGVAPHWLLNLFDESHDLAPKSVRVGPLQRYAKRARKRGIHCAFASQRPADVSHTVITQCTTHIYFALNSYENEYFARYDIPLDEFREWIERPWHFVVVQGQRWARFRPVPRLK